MKKPFTQQIHREHFTGKCLVNLCFLCSPFYLILTGKKSSLNFQPQPSYYFFLIVQKAIRFYTYPESGIYKKVAPLLISGTSKIPKVREFNFWVMMMMNNNNNNEMKRSFVKIFPVHGKYLIKSNKKQFRWILL